jgi:hypothetical protein
MPIIIQGWTQFHSTTKGKIKLTTISWGVMHILLLMLGISGLKIH